MRVVPFAELKQQYPKPVSSRNRNSNLLGYYCVGGAFCLAHGYTDYNFPRSRKLAEIIVQVFGIELDGDVHLVREKAHAVTIKNDNLLLDQAWDALRAVYDAYGPGRRHER